MESNNHEESGNYQSYRSSELHDEFGAAGRSYQCVYCKRGFTTAQALGGHMNIHRKDRAKSGLAPHSSYSKFSKYREIYSQAESYLPISEPQLNQYSCFPPSSTDARSSYAHNYNADLSAQMPHPYEEDWLGGMRWQVGGRKEKTQFGNCAGEDELDLELRLGHDP